MNSFYKFSPGERIRIKSYAEIAKTFDSPGSMSVGSVNFLHEMKLYCGSITNIHYLNKRRENGDASYWLRGIPDSWLGSWLESLESPQIDVDEVEELL